MAAQEAVVRVRSERCDSVTESEEFVGRFRLGSLLPQYLQLQSDLVVHVLNGGIEDLLDNCDVNRSRGSGPKDRVVCCARHCIRRSLVRKMRVQKVVCRKVSQLRGTGFPSRATGQSRLALAARAVRGARISSPPLDVAFFVLLLIHQLRQKSRIVSRTASDHGSWCKYAVYSSSRPCICWSMPCRS